MTHYEQLVAAIHKAVPEILELKFGCRVIDEVGQIENVLWSQKNWKGYTEVKLDGTAVPIPQDQLKEILGREITLADVLVTIKNKKRMSAREWFDAVDHLVGRSQWNLALPLSLQSDPLKEWLWSIICVKK